MMQKRVLGRTGVEVGALGLGLEHLENSPPDLVASVVHAALDAGACYLDLWMATPRIRDAVGAALRGRRDQAFVAGHLGAVLSDGKTERSRDPATAGRAFDDFLARTDVGHADVAMLFWVDEPADYDRVFGPGGTAELAAKLKQQGKARFIGMSSHYAPTALRAVRSGLIDVLMFPVNPAFDALPPTLRIEALWEAPTYDAAAGKAPDAVAAKRALYQECAARGVAIVAMKPFAAGWLFKPDNPSGMRLTPVQCLQYTLSRPGVCVALPGCRSVDEVQGCLAWLAATEAERDFGAISASALWKLQGACMYCGHCLPCPAGIDVGEVTRLRDAARAGDDGARAAHAALAHGAGECTDCGVCTARCPFGVNAALNVQDAARVLA